MRLLNKSEPGIFLVDEMDVTYSNTLGSQNWIKREHAPLQNAFRNEDLLMPMLENFPQIAQLPIDEYRDSMANLRLIVPEFSMFANSGDPKIQPLCPVQNFHRLTKEVASELLGTLRSTQVETVSVFLPDEDENYCPLNFDKLSETGLLSEKQMDGLSDCIFGIAKVLSVGMTPVEVLEVLQREGALSFHSAVGILHLVTHVHIKMLLQNETLSRAKCFFKATLIGFQVKQFQLSVGRTYSMGKLFMWSIFG